MKGTLAGFVVGVVTTWLSMAVGVARQFWGRGSRCEGCRHHFSYHDTRGCRYVISTSSHRSYETHCGCTTFVGVIPENVP